MKIKLRNSRILAEVHATARGLHKSGLIDKRRMREFDALCKLQVRPLSPRQIRSIRNKQRMSQAVFAAVLNTSVSTVQKWEIGKKKPSGPSLKLLNLIQQKGMDAVL
jgi:putative transcriptional regulator